MGKIYIANKPVAGIDNDYTQHLYIVYDGDGDLGTSNDEYVIRGGPENKDSLDLSTAPWGNISVEADVGIWNSDDTYVNPETGYLDFPEDRNFTEIDLNGADAYAAWLLMKSYAIGMGTLDAVSSEYLTDIVYNPLEANSNSTIASVLYSVGINLSDVMPYEGGDPQNQRLDIDYFQGADVFLGTKNGDEISLDENFSKTFTGAGDDTIITGSGDKVIDGGSGTDTVDYGGLTVGVDVRNSYLRLGGLGDNSTIVEKIDGKDEIDSVEVFKLTNYNDTVNISATAEIFLGNGNDTIKHAGVGSVIHTGAGSDVVSVSHEVLVTDASSNDRIEIAGKILTGGIRAENSESLWSRYSDAGVKYSVNTDGDLVIKDVVGRTMFVNDFDTSLTGEQTAGILLAVIGMDVRNIREGFDDFNLYGNFIALKVMIEAITGVPMDSVDPLMLDLDGDGFDLTANSVVSSHFDLNDDGFAERSGWTSGDDGFLVRDLNGDGSINDISEMFGNRTTSGFSALSALDTNTDGVVDANDTDFADLRVWVDADRDAVTDAGELKTLAELGIESISVTPDSTTTTEIAGNEVTATGTYTRADGTTGTVGDVHFQTNTYDSVWLENPAITAQAEALPEVKGMGTLPNLRAAMSFDSSFATIVENTLPNMSSHDLGALRTAALPILNGWMDVVDVEAGSPGTASRVDVPILVTTSLTDGAQVLDYATQTTDQNGTYWQLASENDVLDAQGVVIERPTLADIYAQTPTEGSWETFESDYILFIERMTGVDIPLGMENLTGSDSLDAGTQILSVMWQELNKVVVKIASQGELSDYFDGVEYNVESDKFEPTDGRDLTPLIENIFADAPTTATEAQEYLAGWKPMLDVVIDNYERQGDLMVSYAYLFQHVVAAYENIGYAGGIVDAAAAFDIPSDIIFTGAGDFSGTNDNDILYISDTNTHNLTGGVNGVDNYVFGQRFGQTTITEVDNTNGDDNPDIIRFAHANSTDFVATRVGNDLILTHDTTGDSVTIVDQFIIREPNLVSGYIDYARGVSEIAFADGVVWDNIDMAWAVSHPLTSDDTLIGTGKTDVLDGGLGNDYLSGGDEGDVYIYGANYGHDAIFENAQILTITTPDFVKFTGLNAADVTFGRGADLDDLVITVNDSTTDSLTIEDQFNRDYASPFGDQWFDRIETFVFDDGSSVDWDDLFAGIVSAQKTDGDDVIYGFSWSDTLDGGAGNDYLSGGNESDTYLFGFGYGNDVIYEDRDNIASSNNDVLRFNSDVTLADVTFSRVGDSNDLNITLSDGSTLEIQEQFDVDLGFGIQITDAIDQFEFTDGSGIVLDYGDIMDTLIAQNTTSGDDVVYGFTREDTFEKSAGNDALHGGAEGDTYHFGRGAGNDIIEDEEYPIAIGDDIDRVVMDTDIATSDITLSVGDNPDNMILQINDTGETLTLVNQNKAYTTGSPFFEIENVEFNDGTVWSAQDMRDQYLANAGTSGDDTIYGFFTNDTLDGGAGNDMLYGGGGSDTYNFGVGYGQDTIHDYIEYINWATNDTVQFQGGLNVADVTFSSIGDDLLIEINNSTDTLTIDRFFFGSYQFYTVENLVFADATLSYSDVYDLAIGGEIVVGTENGETLAGDDGNDHITGLGGNDNLYGFAGNDYLDGGAGNDSLKGGTGNDTYFASTGTDAFEESGGTDEILFGEGVTFDDLSFMKIAPSTGVTSLKISWGEDNSITVYDYFDTSYTKYQIESLRFEDGAVYDLVGNPLTQTGTDGADAMGGVSSNSVGLSMNDTIYGMGGDDIINAYRGDDVIIGGTGNDTLEGGYGNDTYIFGRGDGADTINNDDQYNNTTIDRLEFLNGVDYDQIWFEKSGYNLIVSVIGTEDSITFKNWYSFSSYTQDRIDIVQDGLGHEITTTQVHLLVNAMALLTKPVFGETELPQTTKDALGTLLEDTWGVNIAPIAQDDDFDVQSDTDYSGNMFDDNGYGADNDANTSDVLEVSAGTYSTEHGQIAVEADGDFTYSPDAGYTGTDTYQYSLEDGNGGYDTAIMSFDIAQNEVNGTTGDDSSLIGTAGGDIINSDTGDDVISGGLGNDTYLFSRGDGTDSIIEDDSVSLHDLIEFDNTVDFDQLWFEESGDDLVISTIGTNDSVTVDDWYVSSSHQVDYIQTGDGYELTAGEVQTLVTAMANETKPDFGTTELSPTQYDTLLDVMGGVWDQIPQS